MKVGDEVYWRFKDSTQLKLDIISKEQWWSGSTRCLVLFSRGKSWTDLMWVVPKNELTAILYGVEC